MNLARKYLFLFGALHWSHLFSLLGVYETIAEAPRFLPVWWWHMVLFIVYGILPTLYACRGNEYIRVALAASCIAGVLIEGFKVFTWVCDSPWLYLCLGAMDLLAVVALIIDKF